jgi:hypothetical protein
MSDHDPLCRQQHWEGGDCFDCRLIAKVRADERGRQEEGWAARLNSTVAWAENGVRAELRAKVGALRAEAQLKARECDAKNYTHAADEYAAESLAYDAVLALLEGGSA